MIKKKWDIIIVGGGLAGLSLAKQLSSQQFSHLDILLIEARKQYFRDRTWSYWRDLTLPAHPFAALERTSWKAWQVKLSETVATQAHPDWRYCTIDSNTVYDDCLKTIHSAAHIDLRLDTRIMTIHDSKAPSIILESGEVISASWIIDARQSKVAVFNGIRSGLVQTFLGWEIQADSDVFDEQCVGLMHFIPNKSGLHFFYILPYSKSNALIETTWVCPVEFQINFDNELKKYLQEYYKLTNYTIQYFEKGELPLDAEQSKLSQRVVKAGSSAGTLRASTGYAFLDTLAHNSKLISSLQQAISSDKSSLDNWQPTAFRRKRLDLMMDRIFLMAIQKDYMYAPQLFMAMFSTVDAQTLINFLNGQATWRQRLMIISALPKIRLIISALKVIFR